MTVPPLSPGGAGAGAAPPHELARRKARLLQHRCDQLHHDNEALMHRIYQVKKLTKKYKKEIKFLMARLDMHGDAYRTIKMEEDVKPNLSSFQHFSAYGTIKTEKNISQRSGGSDRNPSAKKSSSKRKPIKSEKRPVTISEGNLETSIIDPSKREVPRPMPTPW